MNPDPRRGYPRRILLGWILFGFGIISIIGGLLRDGGIWLVVGLLLTSVGIQMLLSRTNREASRHAKDLLGRLRQTE